MLRRPRHWTVRVAMLLGIAIGIWLLAQLRPGRVETPPPRGEVAAPPPRTAPPQLTPARRAAPDPPATPTLEPALEDEAAVEPTDTADEQVTVVIVLEDADGYAVEGSWPFVTGCEILAYRRTDALEFELTVARGDWCSAWAGRRDGLLVTRTDEVEFEALPGTEVTLVFPVERTGGIGVRFQPMGDFVEVVDVLPGTPAWTAGLAPGDRIVSVGGIPVADLDADGFVDEMTGPEGTDVEFELEFDADTGLTVTSVAVTRAFLSG